MRLIFFLCLCGATATWAQPPQTTRSHLIHLAAQHGAYGSARAVQDVTEKTDFVVRNLTRARRICGGLTTELRAACVYTEYDAIAQDIRGDRDLAPVAQVLRTTSRDLRAASRPVRDRAAPQVRVQFPAVDGLSGRTSAPLIPVVVDEAPGVNRAASERVAASADLLLRSIPDDDPRQANFQRIAAAFDDSAVLLRSG